MLFNNDNPDQSLSLSLYDHVGSDRPNQARLRQLRRREEGGPRRQGDVDGGGGGGGGVRCNIR